MADTHYDVLGVAPTASADEIRHAYHALAMRYHPDHSGDVPEQLRHHLDEMMTTLNEAWATLGDSAKRADYDRTLDAPTNGRAASGPQSASYDEPVARPLRSDECLLCGSSPAVEITLWQATGKLIWWVRRSLRATLCRDCGLAEFRSFQNRTLITGWWGIISFFANVLFVLSNAGAAIKLQRLAAPTRTELIDAPLPRPLSPGKPLFARAGIWIAVVIIAGLGAIIATSPSSNTAGASSADWSVGSCVSGTSTVHPIDCSDSHDGKIVATRTAPEHCPAIADGYADDGSGTVYCIDSSQ